MNRFLTTNGFLSTTLGGIAVTKILKSPVLLRGTVGSLALFAAGYTYVKLSGSKRGIESRKKVATTFRDKANTMIDSLNETAPHKETVTQENW